MARCWWVGVAGSSRSVACRVRGGTLPRLSYAVEANAATLSDLAEYVQIRWRIMASSGVCSPLDYLVA